jgi:AcrR family transcriptional regulator
MTSTTRAQTPAGRYGDVEGRLLAATEELLASGLTFTELGIQRVTAKAGVARSTFYVYFTDKTGLLLRLTQRLGETIFEFFERWRPDDPDALRQLEQHFVDVTHHFRQNAHLLAAVLEVAAYDREFAAFWQHRLDPFLANVTDMLRVERAAGRTARSVDPDAASQVMVAGSMQAVAQQIGHGDEGRDAQVARELARQQWYGAYRRPDVD